MHVFTWINVMAILRAFTFAGDFRSSREGKATYLDISHGGGSLGELVDDVWPHLQASS